jgi:hypothetical protein
MAALQQQQTKTIGAAAEKDSNAAAARLTLARMAAFQWFLTAFSVRPSNLRVMRAAGQEQRQEPGRQAGRQGEQTSASTLAASQRFAANGGCDNTAYSHMLSTTIRANTSLVVHLKAHTAAAAATTAATRDTLLLLLCRSAHPSGCPVWSATCTAAAPPQRPRSPSWCQGCSSESRL